MAEREIDISGRRAKELEEFIGAAPFDYLITVCERDEEACPAFPGKGRREHWPFKDPARAEGSDGERMARFRDVRDQIEVRVRSWVEAHRLELASAPNPTGAGRAPAAPRAVGQDGRSTGLVREGSATSRDELIVTGRKVAP